MSYPAHLASDVVLRDGSTVALRPVRPEDEPLLLEFYRSLDERSLAFRFFTGAPNLKASAQILAEVDYGRRFGLLAFRGPEPHPVGHGFFAGYGADKAEVAFAVSAELQGHGLGSILLAQLAERAAEAGISTFVADVLPENHRMVSMFRASGFPTEVHAEPEAIVVEMPTSLSPAAIARFEERDRLAARAAVRRVFDPDSVAPIDGPAAAVLERARECAASGAGAIVVRADLGAGEEAAERERELLAICRAAGMRLVGPASFGVLDTAADPPLNLTPSPLPTAGGIGIATQSGEVGRELLELAGERDLGISSFASLGERLDLTANDLLEYWEEDEATAVVLLHVESFSDPGRFGRVARRVGRRKPIVVGTAHHAEAAPARGLFEQAGVLLADSPAEMIDLATALSGGDLPAGADEARVLGKVTDHAERLARGATEVSAPPGARPDEAAAILASALAATAAELDPEAGRALLDCCGIAIDASADAGAAAARLRVRVAADPLFGPVLTGAPTGGSTEREEAWICPLDSDDAAAILGSPAFRAALGDVSDHAPLERTLEALAAAAAQHAEIAALELDPLVVRPDGAAVAGAARVEVRRPPRRRPWPRTWD